MRKVRILAAVTCVGLWAAAFSTPTAHAACKRGLENKYENTFFVAKVTTNWCYRRGNVTRRKSIPRAWIKTAGMFGGWQEGSVEVDQSTCYRVGRYRKHNCLTQYQFSFWNVVTSPVFKVGVCLHTRIYGNGDHRRRMTTNC